MRIFRPFSSCWSEAILDNFPFGETRPRFLCYRDALAPEKSASLQDLKDIRPTYFFEPDLPESFSRVLLTAYRSRLYLQEVEGHRAESQKIEKKRHSRRSADLQVDAQNGIGNVAGWWFCFLQYKYKAVVLLIPSGNMSFDIICRSSENPGSYVLEARWCQNVKGQTKCPRRFRSRMYQRERFEYIY